MSDMSSGLSEQAKRPPRLSTLVRVLSWALFAGGTVTLLGTILVSTKAASWPTVAEWTLNIQIGVQLLLGLSGALHSYAAAEGFSARYKQITWLVKSQCVQFVDRRPGDERASSRPIPGSGVDGLRVLYMSGGPGGIQADRFIVLAKSWFLLDPVREVPGFEIHWSLRDYIEGLENERKAARASAARLAGALGGMFAANVLAAAKLVDALAAQ